MLYPSNELLIQPVKEAKIIQGDIKILKNWVQKAEKVKNSFKGQNLKIISFSTEITVELGYLFQEMNQLPLLSEENMGLFKHIYILNWLNKANTILQKDPERTSSNNKENKAKSFLAWDALNSLIEPLKSEENVSEAKIYKTFQMHYLKARKL